MKITPEQIRKYQATAKKHGLILREVDIMLLRGFMSQIAREEIEKARKTHGQKTGK